MKYFSDFCISYRRGNLSIVRGSGLKATKGVLNAGWSDLNPHRGANIIAGGAQRRSPHRGRRTPQTLKGRSDKALPCPFKAWRLLDNYLRSALLMAIILRPAQGSKELLKQALAL